MAVCHVCNDEGKEGGCPRCGLTPRKAVGRKLQPLEIATDIIPNMYQGRMWKPSEEDNKSERAKSTDASLEKVYDQFLQGRIPEMSLFLYAPPKSGKMLFAYACMQTALVHKFTVAPLLSTADWRRLQAVSQERPTYKLFGKYRWDTLVLMDVAFLYVDHSDEKYSVIPLLKSIFDARAVFSRPTFVISDYKLEELVPKWESKEYLMIYNTDRDRDYLRYPVILHREE